MAELDAAFFHLYGVERDEAEYILSTFTGLHEKQPLLPGVASIAQRVLQKYEAMALPG